MNTRLIRFALQGARIAAATCVLWAFLGAPDAPAQSWLSESPAAASAKGGALGIANTVPQLLDLVDKVPARDLYPALNNQVQAELAGVTPARGEGPPWQRKALAALVHLADGAGLPAEEERWARVFVDRFPDDDQFPIVFVELNEALLHQDKPPETSFFFDQTAQNSLPPAWLSRYLMLQATAAEHTGDYIAAAGFRLQEYDAKRGAHVIKPQDVLDTLDRVTDPAALVPLLTVWDRIPWLHEQAPFLKVRALIHGGQLSEALIALEQLEGQSSGLTDVQRKLLLDARTEVRRRVGVRPDRIGILLPLSSSSAALRELARDTLDGLRMALTADAVPDPRASIAAVTGFDPMPPRETSATAVPTQGNLNFELIVRDTGNDPQIAAQTVQTLAQQDSVVAIIGPLARAESEAAAARAEEIGVPLISLSLSLDLPPGAQYVFRNSKSQEEEVRDLVWYAMDYLQERRFAILYPSNAYGERMLQLFTDEMLRKGGSLVAASAFTPWNVKEQPGDRAPVGLKQIFESFVGQDRPLKQSDRDLLEAVGDPKPDPIVDFDALFIPLGPDAGQDLRLIAPYPVTVDAENVQLLGTRFWNDDAVLVAGAGKLDGAVFPDVYDRSSAQPKVAAFQNRHHTMFGHRPRYATPSYYTAVGYDTLSMLMTQLRDIHNRSRDSLAHSLKTGAPYPGITGLTAFRSTGEASKETVFFKVRGTDFVRLQP